MSSKGVVVGLNGISREEYIGYHIELLISRRQQLKAHANVERLQNSKNRLHNPASLRDPRIQKRVAELDDEIIFAKERFKAAVTPMMPRINFLVGSTMDAPPMDILYPNGAKMEPASTGKGAIEKAYKDVEEMQIIVKKLKTELLSEDSTQETTPNPPLFLETTDSSPFNTPKNSTAKRRRIADGTILNLPASTSSITTPTRPDSKNMPTIKHLLEHIADLHKDLDQIVDTRIEAEEAKARNTYDETARELGRLMNDWAGDEESAASETAEIDAFMKVWKASTAEVQKQQQALAQRKEALNSRIKAENDIFLRRTEEIEKRAEMIDKLNSTTLTPEDLAAAFSAGPDMNAQLVEAISKLRNAAMKEIDRLLEELQVTLRKRTEQSMSTVVEQIEGPVADLVALTEKIVKTCFE